MRKSAPVDSEEAKLQGSVGVSYGMCEGRQPGAQERQEKFFAIQRGPYLRKDMREVGIYRFQK
jgi:hypothetical protein